MAVSDAEFGDALLDVDWIKPVRRTDSATFWRQQRLRYICAHPLPRDNTVLSRRGIKRHTTTSPTASRSFTRPFAGTPGFSVGCSPLSSHESKCPSCPSERTRLVVVARRIEPHLFKEGLFGCPAVEGS